VIKQQSATEDDNDGDHAGDEFSVSIHVLLQKDEQPDNPSNDKEKYHRREELKPVDEVEKSCSNCHGKNGVP